MGEFISAHLPMRLVLSGNDNFNLMEEKDKVIKDLEEVIDLSSYDMIIEDDCIEFLINKEKFENNIHDAMREMHPYMECYNAIFWHLDKEKKMNEFKIEDFTKENYPMILKQRPEDYYMKDEAGYYYIVDGLKESGIAWDEFSYILLRNSKFRDDVEIRGSFLRLWSDYNKIGEDCTEVCYLLTIFSKEKFKNPLLKSIMFYTDL